MDAGSSSIRQKKKKRKNILIGASVFVLVLALALVISSVSRISGMRSYDEQRNDPLKLSSGSIRSKRINLEVKVEGDKGETGTIEVEVLKNDGSDVFKEQLKVGDSIDETFYLSRGNKEKIVIIPQDFEGRVRYSVFYILFI